jgi:hypothetical protein
MVDGPVARENQSQRRPGISGPDRTARGAGRPAGPGRRRDHRQGLCQPAARTGQPCCAGRPPLHRPAAARRPHCGEERLMRYENVAIPAGLAWSSPFARWHGSLAGRGGVPACSPVAQQAIPAQPSSSASTTESCSSGHRLPADRVPDLQDRLPRSADSRPTTGTRASMNSICFSGVQYLGCSTEDSTTPFCTTRSRSM